MKKFKFLGIIAILFVISVRLQAQNNSAPKPLIIQTMYISPSEATMRVNLDSLLKIWKERVMNPNPFFVSTKIVQHWWGHDSREVIFIFELKSWDDIERAFEKRNEILKDHKGWATKEDAQAFGKLWRSIFFNEPHHSDEIYQVVAE